MIPSRKAWVSGTGGFLALLCVVGCTTPLSKPPLSVDTQAEALSNFSLGLLAAAANDSVAALEHLEAAIRLDPSAATLYPPAVALALKLNQPEDALRLARQLRKKQPRTVDALLLLARVTALTDQPVAAETIFTQAVSEFPENPETHLSLARFFLSQDRSPEAIQTLESARGDHDDSVALLQLLGGLIVEESSAASNSPAARPRILKGIRLLEKALERDGSDPKRWQQVGYVHLSIKQLEPALAALETAQRMIPEDIDLARQVMELSIRTGDYDHALELSENLPEETGTDPEAWLQFLIEKTPPEQREKLTEYLKDQLRQKNPPVFYYTQLGSLYLDGKHHAEATACLLEALTIYPNDGRLRTVLGYLHLQEEKYDDAYAAFDHVRTHSPDTEWAQNPFFAFNFMIAAQKSDHLEEAVTTLASTYTNDPVVLNQYMHSLLTGQSPISVGAAIDLLESFHQLSPKAVEALYYLTLLQTEEKEYEAALGNAQRVELLAQDQGNTNLLDGFFYYQYATLHERTGQIEDAENNFFKAIELGDAATAASAQNYIAYMWAERGEKLEFGLELIGQALSAEPDNAAFIDTQGWIYYMQGRYEEALTQLKIASELFSEDSTVWEHLGDTYLKLGNPTAALEHWEKALDLSPDEQRLKDRLKNNRISPADHPAEEDTPEDTPPRP